MNRPVMFGLAVVAAVFFACTTGGDDSVIPTSTGSPAAVAPSCTFADSTPLVFASVTQVITDAATGTAFAIGDGEFVTAAHVVFDASEITLRTSSAEAPAELIGVELDTDIAILRSEIAGIEPVQFGDLDELAAGQSVAVAGYPRFVEDDPSVVSGLLSKIVEDPDVGFGTFLQTDAAVNVGNSGGPMFNECGQVTGMIVRKIVDTSIEGISWAVAENTIQTALPRVRRKGPPPAQTEPTQPVASSTDQAVDFLNLVDIAYFALDDAFVSILDDWRNEVVDDEAAMSLLYALEEESYAYADTILAETAASSSTRPDANWRGSRSATRSSSSASPPGTPVSTSRPDPRARSTMPPMQRKAASKPGTSRKTTWTTVAPVVSHRPDANRRRTKPHRSALC